MEELDQVKQELADTNEKLAEVLKEVEGLQSLRGAQSNEIGEARKQLAKLEELETLVKDLKGSRDALLDEVKTLKEKGSGAVKGPTPTEAESEREKADRLEAGLTDKEREKVVKIMGVLKESDDPSDKAQFERYKSDDAYRVALFEQVKDRQPADDELFRVKPKVTASGEDVKSLVAKLMKQDRVRNVVVPDERGTRGGGAETPRPSGPVKFG